jgi:hypothetical protein
MPGRRLTTGQREETGFLFPIEKPGAWLARCAPIEGRL